MASRRGGPGSPAQRPKASGNRHSGGLFLAVRLPRIAPPEPAPPYPPPGQNAARRGAVDGHEVTTYSYGSGAQVVFPLKRGPGPPCDYLRDPHLALVERGYRVVTHDQLGCGASAFPASALSSTGWNAWTVC